MRPPTLALLSALLAACATVPAAREPDRERPAEKSSNPFEGAAPINPTIAAQDLAERFPGAKRIDLVKTLLWPQPRQGSCWSQVLSAEETGVDATYQVGGFWPRTETVRSTSELLERGWVKIYRSPQGVGFERRSSFRAIDLTLASELACRCAPTAEVAEERTPITLRVRWQSGKMPEVSASTVKDGRRSGLVPAVTTGRLVTYQFPVRAAFPGDRGGGCGANLALTLLVEPPIL